MNKFDDKCEAMGWEGTASGAHTHWWDIILMAADDTLTPDGAVAVWNASDIDFKDSVLNNCIGLNADFCTAVKSAWMEIP